MASQLSHKVYYSHKSQRNRITVCHEEEPQGVKEHQRSGLNQAGNKLREGGRVRERDRERLRGGGGGEGRGRVEQERESHGQVPLLGVRMKYTSRRHEVIALIHLNDIRSQGRARRGPCGRLSLITLVHLVTWVRCSQSGLWRC